MRKNNQTIQNFMTASKSCTILGTIYGKCIVKNANNIQKDACVSEFQNFKNCLEKTIKRKW